MNLRAKLARITRGPSGAAKNNRARVFGNRHLRGEQQADHVTSDVRQTAAKIKEVFERWPTAS